MAGFPIWCGAASPPTTAAATWARAPTALRGTGLWVGFVDNNGDDIDFSSVTGVCEILDEVGGTVVVSVGFTGTSDGSFTIEVDEADTAGLNNSNPTGRACVWRLVIDDGTDFAQMWQPSNSAFWIYPEA